MNRLKTLVLLATLSAIFVLVGGALGGQSGLVMGLAFAGLTNFAAYWWSDKLVLRMHGAREVGAHEAPDLHRMVQELAQRADMPIPKVYIIPEEAPNAFATGRNPEHAAVAVTQGALRILDREELNSVLAHELAHVKNHDTLIMTVAATLAGALSMVANMAIWGTMLGGSRADNEENGSHPVASLVGVLMAPIAASLIQMAISRSREFMADATGARFSGRPLALASALRKIEAWNREVPMSTGSPASAHMFIINPFSGGGIARLFST
ncbi:MAG TPA: zinc metalloprotease HtpX, partial [Candidatus Binatia bacterium]